jgi:GTP-binding protein
MFKDEITFRVKAGDGGVGVVSFLQELFMPKGGPDGGDGGKGGDVVLVADPNYNTLSHLGHLPRVVAKSGKPGSKKNCSGRNGLDLEIHVPVGTLVRDVEKNVLLKDLAKEGDRLIVCKGGKGGLGNQHFATSTIQAPRKTAPPVPGEERKIKLELKMIADVGLVGLPNAGKSTLLSTVSAARPKIAGYPFTTLIPNLGILKLGWDSLVLADLPGLIEGAHEGKGLGDKFLKHVERTRIILHLVDCSPDALQKPGQAYATIRKELESYSPVLAAKPEVLVATKMDITGAQKGLTALKKASGRKDILEISAATRKGLKELARALFAAVRGDGVVK